MSNEEKRKFAVFDIDGTLVRWQFFHAIVHELGRKGLIDADTHTKIREARMQWKRREGEESFRAYEAVLVHSYLAALESISEADHASVIDNVFEEYRDQLFTYARDLLRQYKKEGRLIFAISGSHEAVLKKLAEHLEIDDFVGAVFEYRDGQYTGNRRTPIEDKAAALRKLVEKYDVTFKDSVAIGDSESDIAMLELVDKPIAFNPTKELFKEAKKQGWKVVIERKNMIYELENDDGKYTLAETKR
jgi:HAD superfamily hydrolase (TIGR01490 family)